MSGTVLTRREKERERERRDRDERGLRDEKEKRGWRTLFWPDTGDVMACHHFPSQQQQHILQKERESHTFTTSEARVQDVRSSSVQAPQTHRTTSHACRDLQHHCKVSRRPAISAKTPCIAADLGFVQGTAVACLREETTQHWTEAPPPPPNAKTSHGWPAS